VSIVTIRRLILRKSYLKTVLDNPADSTGYLSTSQWVILPTQVSADCCYPLARQIFRLCFPVPPTCWPSSDPRKSIRLSLFVAEKTVGQSERITFPVLALLVAVGGRESDMAATLIGI
jgi:hypothetical protein